MPEVVKFDSDDLIYNRFDLIYKANYREYRIEYENKLYVMQYVCDDYTVYVNVWGKEFPQQVFDECMEYIFSSYKHVDRIEIQAGRNNYQKQLVQMGDVVIALPDNTEALWSRLNKKGRYNIRWEKRKLENEVGTIDLRLERDSIAAGTVEKYFEWKRITHGTDYHLTAQEYIEHYHVTDAISLFVKDHIIAVLFFCQNNETVYFENFSYDTNYGKYSPGLLIYAAFLEEMVKRGIRFVFLGKAGLDYKKRFGSVEYPCYCGKIYRKEVFDKINRYFVRENINRIAIYGLGKVGKEFIQLLMHIHVKLIFGIDRNVKEMGDLKIFKPEELGKAPAVDLVVITMNQKNKEVENILKSNGNVTIYFSQLFDNGTIL